MNHQSNNILGRIIPYIGMGIFLVLIVIAFVLLSYILLIGGIIGLIIFSVVYLKERFFSKRNKQQVAVQGRERHGKVYDHHR